MTVRELRRLIDAIHAPVYFAVEPLENYKALGLKGYWRGYFGGRAAALGEPSAHLVTSLFGGFAPSLVAHIVPDVWSVAASSEILKARHEGAVAALQRLVADTVTPEQIAAAAELTDPIVANLSYECRPLAAANADLPRPDEPLAALWHDCTVLREYRGDNHLVALIAADLSWPQAHLIGQRERGTDDSLRNVRGWTEQEWEDAKEQLRARGLWQSDAATELVEEIERRTDQLTETAFADVDLQALQAQLRPIARAAFANVPFPNPMGLRPPT